MRVILLTKSFNQSIDEEVEVILSPEFYWIKKIEAPIKHLREAKKIAHNLFRLSSEEYFFDAFEQNGLFYAVALPKKIDLGVDKKFIKSIRLAQIELKDYECINTDNGSLQKIEELLFFFPYKKGNCPHIQTILQDLKLSKHTFNFYKQTIGKKELIAFTTPFLLLITLLLINGFAYRQEYQTIEKKIENIRQTYHLPPTTFQLHAILNELQKKYDQQVKIRKALERLSRAPLDRIEQLRYKNGHYFLIAKASSNPTKFFSNRFHVIKQTFTNDIYKVEFTYE